MRKLSLLLVGLILVSMTGLVSAQSLTIDGDYTDWTNYEEYKNSDNGYAGANITTLWVSWDNDYLYLFLFTNNTASWNVAYGFAFDVNVSSVWGYRNSTNGDAWGRHIAFNASSPNFPDFELYFWWDENNEITSQNLAKWNGDSWEYASLDDIGVRYAYTGNTTTGLRTLEIAIPWSAFGGKPTDDKIAVAAWVAGGEGSSAVKTIEADPTVPVGDSWTDWDNLGLLANQVVTLDSTTYVPFFGNIVLGVFIVLGVLWLFRKY